MIGLLRLLQLLAMVVWVGGLIFFAFVLAPAVFHTLPTIHEAGLVVEAALRLFDMIALGAGGLFLAVTALLYRLTSMRIKGRYEMEFLLAGVMLLGTAYIQFNILPAMDRDLARANGDIATVPVTHPARVHFDKLHVRSERVEGAVLLIGLGVVFLMSREHLRLG